MLTGVISYVGPIQETNSKAKYFTIVISDKTSDIKVNCTPEFTSIYKQMAPYKSLQIKNGHVRVTQPKYKALDNDMELILTPCSEVKILKDTKKDCVNIIASKLVKIADISEIQPGKYIDVVVYVKSLGLYNQLTSGGSNRSRREALIADDSGASIKCTFWGARVRSYIYYLSKCH
jgi:hypothetical protein